MVPLTKRAIFDRSLQIRRVGSFGSLIQSLSTGNFYALEKVKFPLGFWILDLLNLLTLLNVLTWYWLASLVVLTENYLALRILVFVLKLDIEWPCSRLVRWSLAWSYQDLVQIYKCGIKKNCINTNYTSKFSFLLKSFYIIGSNIAETYFKILKLDRTCDIKTLEFCEDVVSNFFFSSFNFTIRVFVSEHLLKIINIGCKSVLTGLNR